ncbi:archaeal proteasome endopeptidase complex subunit beta [Hyperthermus butylicus]|uniref:Proteasome subunit beta 2 n=1 Tax=Hyperthermus butylicus (strain DSM 5456 / JCM 9403 / PLM1-5) TaxID=415426 RepID=PSB2_HYPBU|nr:archaeal proteasome endopeptidase complex subunit beta [Hyperthermus butylicus]A2BN27.1 RecName: Full=Proteasome subunit beta 2; AltName: Full=20S proteasome beta subunit 2; AltName: Full=Proteasome core protein PsmB 2; Flags: Precursor [Hyperthermus butylicus DSM 5456]ABM81388.1 proteasome beta precursor [Hyperthermus butylicus DSM 5456]
MLHHPGTGQLRALKGTTTVGIVFRDFVVLAADRRATAGYFVAHKRTKKIIKITDYMAMTTAGLVADAQMLAEWLANHTHYYEIVNKRRMSIHAAAQYLSIILHSAKFYPYIVQLLLGGYDTQPRLYNIDWFGSVTEEKYVATGSGSPTAIGVIEDQYSPNLSMEEAVELAKRAVASSIRRDTFTGNGVDVVVIGKDFYREYSFELKDILKTK